MSCVYVSASIRMFHFLSTVSVFLVNISFFLLFIKYSIIFYLFLDADNVIMLLFSTNKFWIESGMFVCVFKLVLMVLWSDR